MFYKEYEKEKKQKGLAFGWEIIPKEKRKMQNKQRFRGGYNYRCIYCCILYTVLKVDWTHTCASCGRPTQYISKTGLG